MQYIKYYNSPLGKILLSADEIGLTGLWFVGQKYFAPNINLKQKENNIPIFDDTTKWLDIYFKGIEPNFMPTLHLIGTPFRITVWEILKSIPYGTTMTYKDIAQKIVQQRGIEKMSSQAVGGAVGHNNISIIIPCHRVIDSNGNLTGYAGGIEKKIQLLKIEQNINNL